MQLINLPKTIPTHEQEEICVKNFHIIVPTDKFIIKSIVGRDYGADILLEIKINNSYASNYYNFIQLKDIKVAKRNTDDSFSFQVPVITINYLLNQPNSLFVIYLENEKAFTWAWTKEIYAHGLRNNIDTITTAQDTITYRFTNTLNEVSFQLIHDTTLRNEIRKSEINKNTSLFFDFDNTDDKIIIKKDSITNVEELKNYIKLNAKDLIYNNRIHEIDKLIENLDISTKNDSELALIIAHAKYLSGSLYDALSWLPKTIQRKQLDNDKQLFAEYLELNIKLILNILDENKYIEKVEKIIVSNTNSINALQMKSNLLRNKLLQDLLNDTPIEDKESLLNEIAEISKKILQFENLPVIVKLEAESDLWEMESNKVIHNYLEETYKIKYFDNKNGTKSSNLKEKVMYKVRDEIKFLEEWYNKLKNEASSNIASKSRIVSLYTIFQIQIIAFFNALENRALNKEEIETLNKIINDIDLINGELNKSKLLHHILKNKNIKAELQMVLGEKKEATELLNEIIETADELGLIEISSTSRLIISGDNIFGRINNLIHEFKRIL